MTQVCRSTVWVRRILTVVCFWRKQGTIQRDSQVSLVSIARGWAARGGYWQTPNTGLRHLLEEGAGKRCSECGLLAEPADSRSWCRNACMAAGTGVRSDVALRPQRDRYWAQDVHLDFHWHSSWTLKKWQAISHRFFTGLTLLRFSLRGNWTCDPTWVSVYAHEQRLTLLYVQDPNT